MYGQQKIYCGAWSLMKELQSFIKKVFQDNREAKLWRLSARHELVRVQVMGQARNAHLR